MANRSSTIRKKQGSEMAAYSVTPGNFWDIGNYIRTCKRINENNVFCDDLVKMFTERADIESKYSKRLTEWHEKWSKVLETSCMYATMKTAALGSLKEAKDRAIIHMDCWKKIHNQTVETIKRHKEANYHKAFVGLKEAKEYQEEFTKAQKPWSIAFGKVQSQKKNYHSACKSREIASQNLTAANKDSEVPIDKIKKLEEAVRKSENNVATMRKKYEEKLTRIEPLNTTYEDEMRSVYERWEKDEVKRKDFLQQTLVDFHKAVNICDDPRLKECFDNQLNVAYSGKTKYDVQWFSDNYGVDMPRNWPKFEDYSHTPRRVSRRFTITKRKQSRSPIPDSYSFEGMSPEFFDKELAKLTGDIIKTASADTKQPWGVTFGDGQHRVWSADNCNQKSSSVFSLPIIVGFQFSGEKLSHNVPKVRSQSFGSFGALFDKLHKEGTAFVSEPITKVVSKEFGELPDLPPAVTAVDPPPTQSYQTNSVNSYQQHEVNNSYQPTADPDSNPFMNGPDSNSRADTFDDEDGDWDEPPPIPVPGGGIPVRALYDYTKVEEDELSFRAGDILTKLTEEDQQGWCRGKLNGIDGLYPANYVEPI